MTLRWMPRIRMGWFIEFAAQRIQHETEAFERGGAHECGIALLPEYDGSRRDLVPIFEKRVAYLPGDACPIDHVKPFSRVRFDTQIFEHRARNDSIHRSGIYEKLQFREAADLGWIKNFRLDCGQAHEGAPPIVGQRAELNWR